MLTLSQCEEIMPHLITGAGLTETEFYSRKRSRPLTIRRAIVAKALRSMGMSVWAMGEAMMCCHTTALYRVGIAVDLAYPKLPSEVASTACEWITSAGGTPPEWIMCQAQPTCMSNARG